MLIRKVSFRIVAFSSPEKLKNQDATFFLYTLYLVSGEPGGSAGESEQSLDRRTEAAEGESGTLQVF